MIDREVLIQYAKNQNIVFTKDEIEAYALQTKGAAEQNSMPEMHDIHLEIAKN